MELAVALIFLFLLLIKKILHNKCRENAIRLEEKEKKEKEMLKQIVEEAEEYKKDFYRKRQLTLENNKAANREKEKVRGYISIFFFK